MSRRRKRWARVVVAIAAASMLGGCIVTPLGRQRELDAIVADDRHAVVTDLAVPTTPGVAGCGAQALGGAISRADGTDPQAAADALPWHDRGATPIDLLLAARAAGCVAELRAGTWEDLETVVAAQDTGIVMIDAAPEVRTLFSAFQTSPVMHWALVAGLARDGSEVLIGLPEDRVAIMDRAWFLDRWSRSDHCLIVVAAQREALRNTSADARSIHAQ